MPKRNRISESEWAVMRVVWDRHPVTASEVAEALRRKKRWSDRTVKTLLSRLVKKKALAFESEGKRYLYRPLLTREAGVRAESESFLERVFGGAATPLLAFLVEKKGLSRDEIASLRRLLAEAEAEKGGRSR